MRTASPSARTTQSAPSQAPAPIVARPITAERPPAKTGSPPKVGWWPAKGSDSEGIMANGPTGGSRA